MMETLALDYAFNELKINRLECEVLEFNSKVISFHKKFGFQEEGRKKQGVRKRVREGGRGKEGEEREESEE